MTGHNGIRLLILFLTVAFITGNCIPCMKKGGSGQTGGQSKSTEIGSQGNPNLNVTIRNENDQLDNGSRKDENDNSDTVPVDKSEERVTPQSKGLYYCGPNAGGFFRFWWCVLDGLRWHYRRGNLYEDRV